MRQLSILSMVCFGLFGCRLLVVDPVDEGVGQIEATVLRIDDDTGLMTRHRDHAKLPMEIVDVVRHAALLKKRNSLLDTAELTTLAVISLDDTEYIVLEWNGRCYLEMDKRLLCIPDKSRSVFDQYIHDFLRRKE